VLILRYYTERRHQLNAEAEAEAALEA